MLLGSIALAAPLALPMGCATTDDGDPADTESETTQQLSTSFLQSCDSGGFSTALDTSTMRLFIRSAFANGCRRTNGTKSGSQSWSGRCFNDLSNRNGVLTCAAG
jgi:hypothetical protein